MNAQRQDTLDKWMSRGEKENGIVCINLGHQFAQIVVLIRYTNPRDSLYQCHKDSAVVVVKQRNCFVFTKLLDYFGYMRYLIFGQVCLVGNDYQGNDEPQKDF